MENDLIINGVAYGDIAQRLLESNCDFNSLKLWIGRDGRTYQNVIRQNGEVQACLVTNTTALLRKDEWILLDRAVMDAARQRSRLAADLIRRGLVYNVPNGLGTLVLQTQAASDLHEASVSTTGLEETTDEKQEFSLVNLPLPIIHKDLRIPIRMLNASRNGGPPLDTMEASAAGRKVGERLENLMVGDTVPYQFGGGTLYGYTNHPDRQTIVLSDWTSATGATILSELLQMVQAMKVDARAYGPFVLYTSTDISTNLENDFKDASDKTIRQRLLETEAIEEVATADFFPDKTAVLVQMAPETVRLVNGLSPTTLQWESKGGMLIHLKAMAIMVPQIRADHYGRCAIVHGTTP